MSNTIALSDGTTIACDLVIGDANKLKTTVEVGHQAGKDGYFAQKMAVGDSDGTFKCVLFGVYLDDVTAWVESLEAAQGEVVVITTSKGLVYEDFMIENVKLVSLRAVLSPDGNYRSEVDVSGREMGTVSTES